MGLLNVVIGTKCSDQNMQRYREAGTRAMRSNLWLQSTEEWNIEGGYPTTRARETVRDDTRIVEWHRSALFLVTGVNVVGGMFSSAAWPYLRNHRPRAVVPRCGRSMPRGHAVCRYLIRGGTRASWHSAIACIT